MIRRSSCVSFFFFNDTATTEIYTLSLHDALPILLDAGHEVRYIAPVGLQDFDTERAGLSLQLTDRKSTRLNSSHGYISYAVFCLKKKKKQCCSCYPRVQSMMSCTAGARTSRSTHL